MEENTTQFTPEEIKVLEKFANRINFTKMNLRYGIILKILGENAALLKELNQLRIAGGLDPLPAYQPKM
jgi:hypothetical protein